MSFPEKVDLLIWERLTTFPEMVDSFPKNVDSVRILFTRHTSFVDFVLNWLTRLLLSQTYEKHSGEALRQGADSPREPLRLPCAALWPMLHVGLGRRLHADAGMRTPVVVEADEGGYALPCVLKALEAALAVYDLRLEDSVHTLGDGVVGGLVVFRHAYPYAVLPQFVCIGVAAVLNATVRVMGEPPQLIGRSLRDGHPQSLHGVLRLQRLGEAPAHDLVRVGIRHQVQVAAAVHKVDVRDVAYPELIRPYGDEAADEVPVLAVAVVRVRRMARPWTPLHQLEVAQQAEERIPTGNPVAPEHALRHQPELVIADAGIHLADLPHGVYDTPGTNPV